MASMNFYFCGFPNFSEIKFKENNYYFKSLNGDQWVLWISDHFVIHYLLKKLERILKALTHLSLSSTSLSNILSALKILQYCRNLSMLALSMNFHDEQMPNYENLLFKNLESLILGNCKLKRFNPTMVEQLPQVAAFGFIMESFGWKCTIMVRKV